MMVYVSMLLGGIALGLASAFLIHRLRTQLPKYDAIAAHAANLRRALMDTLDAMREGHEKFGIPSIGSIARATNALELLDLLEQHARVRTASLPVLNADLARAQQEYDAATSALYARVPHTTAGGGSSDAPLTFH